MYVSVIMFLCSPAMHLPRYLVW